MKENFCVHKIRVCVAKRRVGAIRFGKFGVYRVVSGRIRKAIYQITGLLFSSFLHPRTFSRDSFEHCLQTFRYRISGVRCKL